MTGYFFGATLRPRSPFDRASHVYQHFDLFKVGIGPSSSHTVGPMQAARMFARIAREEEEVAECHRVTTELFGSLGATGAGHGSPKAIILGLQGEAPDTVDIDRIEARISEAREVGTISLMGTHAIASLSR